MTNARSTHAHYSVCLTSQYLTQRCLDRKSGRWWGAFVPIAEAPDLLQLAIDMRGQEAQSGANPSDPFVFLLTSVKGARAWPPRPTSS